MDKSEIPNTRIESHFIGKGFETKHSEGVNLSRNEIERLLKNQNLL
tara:strand:+ start:467 stop:604 length:138 start_codon:yes stop_codon:yes gene_type:complete